MNAQLFSDAMSELNEKYIMEAANYQRKSKSHRHIWFSRVACFFLVVLLAGGSVLTFSVEARAAFFGWVREQVENYYEYFFDGVIGDAESKEYELGWLPDNLELIYSGDTAGGKGYIYNDDTNAVIQFYYIFDPSVQKIYVDSAYNEKISVTINGNPGEISIATGDNETSSIIWTDANSNTLFYISGHFDKDTFIRMAESVKGK